MIVSAEILRTAVAVLFPVVGAIYTFFATRRKDVDTRIDALRGETDAKIYALDDRADRHDHRLHALETTVSSLPAKEDLHAVHLQLAALSGHLERIEAHMSGHKDTMARLTAVTDRVEQYLLKRGGE